jgi:hypothetical protein
LEYFKSAYEGKSYSLVHCWRVLKDFKKWKLTYKSFKKTLKNGKAPATMDIEDDDNDKATLPRRPRGHKATTSDMKKDAAALALSKASRDGWLTRRRPLP